MSAVIYPNIVQGTEEWHEVRCGKITASHLDDVLASATAAALKADPKAESKTRQNYRAKLVAERMSGQVIKNSFSSAAMERGTEMEKFARASYEILADQFVDQIGFADHPTISMCGCSPDGFVGERGLVEIKCPNTLTHIGYLRAGVVPTEYVKQMQWQMEVLDRAWCDFVSYDDRMPKSHNIFVRRLHRDEEFIKVARAEVIRFNEQIDADIKAVFASTPYKF
jgi:putative phage-type endonuclease